MRVLVTGAAGFIGSAVCTELHRRGHSVIGVDSLNETLYPASFRRRRIAELVKSGAAEVHVEDLRHCDIDSLLVGVEGVVHEAAIPGLGPSWTAIEEYVTNNIVGTYRLADGISRSQVSMALLASTSSVYGTTATGAETSSMQPASPYGITKLAAEHTWRAVLEQNQATASVILRYFSVFGPRQREDMAIGRFMRNIMEGRPVTITGDGRQTRTYTYIDDIAEITVSALESRATGTFNISGDEHVSVLDLVDIMAQVVGRRPSVEFLPPRRGDQMEVRGDTSSAREVLGFAPRIGLVEGLTRQFAAQLEDDDLAPQVSLNS